jgi:16S rRNA (guanine(1405)-N(7))-methyltransferase
MKPSSGNITRRILQSKKYQHLSFETIERIVQWAAARYKPKEVEKQAKKKLHQVFGAYFSAGEKVGLEKRLGEGRGENREARIETETGNLEPGTSTGNQEPGTSPWKALMRLHASSRERVGIVDDFYQKIFEVAERPSTVIDLACGLNPFSYPWLAEAMPDLPYHGYDIDLHTTASMDRFFKDQGLPVSVSYNDLFISVPEHGSEDLVMLLKTLPCLEQQEKGISEKLLAQMTCDQLIISFPAKSLGGKEKGMVESYRAFLMELIAGSGYGLKGVVPFENETVYVLGKSRE